MQSGVPGRTAGVIAFTAPAAVFVALGLREILFGSEVAAGRVVGTMLAGAFVLAAVALPSLRRLLADLGAFLVGRVSFLVFVLATIAALLFATGAETGAFWPGMSALLVVFSVASGRALAAKRPARLAGALLLLLVNVLVLVAVDFVVRATILPGKSQNSLYIVHDPWLGWKLRPGLSVTRTNETYTSRETINSLGFRTREIPFPKPAGVKRVLLLGDSHTEGYTVNDDETFPARLEAILRETAPIEVVSLGVGGFSTDQELLAYVHYGRRWHPDLVLLEVTANDVKYNVLDRYWRGLKPRFTRCGETLLLEGVPVPDLTLGLAAHPLLRHSAIALTLDASLERFSILRGEEKADIAEAWRVTDLLIRDLSKMVAAEGARLAMFDATPDDVEPDLGFRRIAGSRGVPFVDILPAFAGDIARHRVGGGNLHWNRDGHEAVARFLAPRVLDFLR